MSSYYCNTSFSTSRVRILPHMCPAISLSRSCSPLSLSRSLALSLSRSLALSLSHSLALSLSRRQADLKELKLLRHAIYVSSYYCTTSSMRTRI